MQRGRCMSRIRRMAATPPLTALAVGSLIGCTSAQTTNGAADSAAARVAQDTSSGPELIPAGKGTLRQDDIAIRLQLPGVQVKLIPMQESILRVLSPDSYRALHDLLESRRRELTDLANRRGMRSGSVWYVQFFGLEPDARFVPTDVNITSFGRDYRPIEILPVTSGFGNQRLQQHERQAALYLFEDGIEIEQPLTASIGEVRNSVWETTLRRIRQERALIRSRS